MRAKISISFKVIALTVSALLLSSSAISFLTLLQFQSQIQSEIQEKLLAGVLAAETIVDDLDLDSMTDTNFTEDTFYKPWLKVKKFAETAGYSSVYVMRIVDSKYVFVMDSISDPKNQNEESDNFKEYKDPPDELLTATKNKEKQFTAEPYTDEFGTFKSVFLPIENGASKSLYVIGADVDIKTLENRYAEVVTITLVPALIIILIVIAANVFVLNLILIRPINQIVLGISRTAENLDSEIKINSNDEFKILAQSFNNYLNQLSSIISDLSSGVEGLETNFEVVIDEADNAIESVRSVKNQLSVFENGIRDLHQKMGLNLKYFANNLQVAADLEVLVNKQGVSNSEVQSAMNDLLSSLGKITETNDQILDLMKNLESKSNIGSEKLDETSQTVKEVNLKVNDISAMLEIINAIAKQTNILAMNAAIEAAHAGESGKGFAVVADEIRKLADESSVNAKSISDSIEGIVGLVKNASSFTEATKESFVQINQAVQTTYQAFDQIARKNQTVQHDASEIMQGITEIENIGLDVRTYSKGMVESSQKMNRTNQSVSEIVESMNHEVKGIMDASESITKSFGKIVETTTEIRRFSSITDAIIEKLKK